MAAERARAYRVEYYALSDKGEDELHCTLSILRKASAADGGVPHL